MASHRQQQQQQRDNERNARSSDCGCVCTCCCCSFLFVSCIIVIKILQFLAQFRAPSPPPPRCHLTLTTVQLPYQRQSTFPPHYPRPVSQPASAVLSTKSTIHCESKARESEREREREQKEGREGHKEIKREVLSRGERGAGCTRRTELTLMLPPSPSLSASRRLLFCAVDTPPTHSCDFILAAAAAAENRPLSIFILSSILLRTK